MADFRQAVRGLLRAPTLTIAAVLCLSLGIGSATAIYTAVHTALLRPLPFPRADRLVTVYRTAPQADTWPFAPANFLDLRDGTRTLSNLAAVSTGSGLLEGASESARVSVNAVSGDFFTMLGLPALRGRTFTREDEDPAGPPIALVSRELWRDRFGSDPGLVGHTIRVDGETLEVVGILPADFRVPNGNSVLRADIWRPLRFSPEQATQRRSNFLRLIGRLRDGVSVEVANTELRGVMSGIIEQNPVLRGEQLRVLQLHGESVSQVRGPLLLLLGAVGFVLLIAAANVASLLLARGVARGRDRAVRSVLGASRWDVVRPALLESALLAAAGGALGAALAWADVRLIRAFVPSGLPQLADLAVEPTVLAFTLGLCVAVALLCGIAPAWQAQRSDPQAALRSDTRAGGGRHHRFLSALVMAEVGLSLVLLLGAGLVLRGFERLIGQDPGFDAPSLLSLQVDVAADRYPDDDAVARFLLPALDAVRALPGVEAAGAISLIPYENWGWNFNIRYEGQPGDDPTRLPLAETRTATPGTFEALGQRLIGGRLLEDRDGDDGAPAVVVANQALADRDFPGQDPVGKRFYTGDTTFATIVGIVSNIRNVGPYLTPQPAVYWSYAHSGDGDTSFPLLVRATRDPAGIARSVIAAVHSVDPAAAVSDVRPMTEVIAGSVGRPRFYLVLLGIFAGVALLLALAGLYGVMSYAVAQRTHELGIRSALGSTPVLTLRLVLRQGLVLVAAGTVAGLLGAAALTRLLRGLLYGVSPLDLTTWLLVTLALGLAAAVAILVPARRAATVDPLIAMRAE